MPKHSLFGSSLEIQDETGARQLDHLDPKTARVPKTPTPRGPGQKFVLPDDVKENLPGIARERERERQRERERERERERGERERERERERF